MSSISKRSSSKELFDKYDCDGSGCISMDEFALVLKDLGLQFTEAKQIEYFRLCDQDQDGSIDYEEFRVALFVCDENENNEAFNPGNILRPRDAFNLFDKDSTGSIDEDEFRDVLEYLGIDIDDETHFDLFRKYDKNNSGLIEYNEFKRAWLTLVNPRKELDHRGIHIPTLATQNQIVQMLESALNNEEERESKAIEKAKQWALRQKVMKKRKDVFREALHRYYLEKSASLDLAGQVYIFGDGTSNLFEETHIEDEELLQFLWRQKLNRIKEQIDGEINVKENTHVFWGKEPNDIGFTDSSVVILCNGNILFSWNNNHQRWDNQKISGWQFQNSTHETISDSHAQKDVHVKEREAEIDDCEVIQNVLQYFSKWKVAPRNCNFHKHAYSVLQSSISRDDLAQSVELRGMNSNGLTNLELVKLLYMEFKLEHEHLGEESFLRLKKIEEDISSLRALQKKKMLKRKLIQFSDLRKCIKEATEIINKVTTVTSGNKDVDETQIIRSEGIEGEEISTTRSKWISLDAGVRYVGILSDKGELLLLSNAIRNEKSSIDWHIKSPLDEKVEKFSCGCWNSAVITESGKLFEWGKASMNKLGASSNTSFEIPSKVPIPSVSVSTVSCGASHTGCVTSNGRVFMWGSNSGYRLGLGDTADRNAPTLVENILNKHIYDISCGYCQTMVITKIEHSLEVQNGIQIPRLSGGQLLVAGPQSALGFKFPSFGSYSVFLKDSNQIEPVPIKNISAGFSHQSAVSIEGELFTFGDNTGGCCGHSPREKVISIPTHVSCFFNSSLNPLPTKRIEKSIPYCHQPYYEIDLERIFTIEEIKLWNYRDPSNVPDTSRSKGLRLFPCWIMISQEELPKSEGSLDSALKLSVAKKRFEENVLVTTWNPQIRTRGRYIRIQLEGINLLEFENIEVFGSSVLENSIGRVSKAVCGKRLTGVIIEATDDEININLSQQRLKDATSMKLPDQHGSIRCILCEASVPCEICKLKEIMIKEGLTWKADSDLMELGKLFLNSPDIKIQDFE